MPPTPLRQEFRRMIFEEAYGGMHARRLTQKEAARVLGLSNAGAGATWTATSTRSSTGCWTNA